MISPKLLRGLKEGKYIIYDSIYTYLLVKYKDNFHISKYGYSDTIYVFEKDLKHLQIEVDYEDDENHYFYKYTYKDTGKTNRWKALSGVGGINLQSDFSWFDLMFFGEDKKEVDLKDIEKLRNIFKLKNYYNGRKERLKERFRSRIPAKQKETEENLAQ